jgi:hypothetical protein
MVQHAEVANAVRRCTQEHRQGIILGEKIAGAVLLCTERLYRRVNSISIHRRALRFSELLLTVPKSCANEFDVLLIFADPYLRYRVCVQAGVIWKLT